MLQQTRIQESTVASNWICRQDGILDVLARAAEDNGFIARLTDHPTETLEEYDLTLEEEAALLSGDVAWVEAHVGKLDGQLRTWLDCRLQQERW